MLAGSIAAHPDGSSSISIRVKLQNPLQYMSDVSDEFQLAGNRWRLGVSVDGKGLGLWLYSTHVPLNSDARNKTSLSPSIYRTFGRRAGEPEYEHVIIKDMDFSVRLQNQQQRWIWPSDRDGLWEGASNVKALAFTSAEYGGWGYPKIVPRKDLEPADQFIVTLTILPMT